MGFFCSPVFNEYLLAAENFGLGLVELWEMCFKSVGAIFGGEPEQQRLKIIILEFKDSSYFRYLTDDH